MVAPATGRPPILVDLVFNLLLGFAFALCARDRLRADGPWAAPAFLLVLSFVLIVLMPIGLYLYLAHPDWTWLYLVDPARVPSLALVPVLAAHGGAVIGAWYLSSRLIRAGRTRALLYAAGGTAALFLILVLALRDRLLHYGTHGDYEKSIALDLMDVKLGYVLVALALGIGAAAGFVAVELFRDSRRVRTR